MIASEVWNFNEWGRTQQFYEFGFSWKKPTENRIHNQHAKEPQKDMNQYLNKV